MKSTSNRFAVKPLIPLFMADGRFYILALSQSGIRLFSCTRHHVTAVDPADAPGSIDESLQYDSKQSLLQFHTRTAGGGGSRWGRPSLPAADRRIRRCSATIPLPTRWGGACCRPDTVGRFAERDCMTGGLGPRFPAVDLMPLALANALCLNKFGA